MEIKCLSLGNIGTNCYLISTDKSAVVIDPGFYSEEVEGFLTQNREKQKMILLTHCHFDHISDAERLRTVTGAKIGVGASDNEFLADCDKNLSNLFGAQLKSFSADITFNDLQEFSVGDIDFKVYHTPGHTAGGVCYLCGNLLFSGDTLFCGSIGRTDFPNGDFALLKNSVKTLYNLPEETIVYSGHGPKTTIGYEKYNNPFIRG